MDTTDIFIACEYDSPEDDKLCKKLIKHLQSSLPGTNLWHDEHILPGAEREKVIKEHLGKAQIILLLISADFLASGDCQKVITWAMERYETESTRVIPIRLRHCAYDENAPFVKLEMLPNIKGHKWVASYDTDETFKNIVEGIKRVISELRKQPPSRQPRAPEIPQTPLADQDQPESEKSQTWKELLAFFKLGTIWLLRLVKAIILRIILVILKAAQQSWIKIKTHWRIALIVLILLIILVPIFHLLQNSGQTHSVTSTNQPLISDGRYPLDTDRADGQLKKEAAQSLKDGDTKAANALWGLALEEEPNDAEPGIYIENQQVLDSHQPYLTFVVAAPIGSYIDGDLYTSTIGQDILQGAYIAQQEYNDPHPLTRVRLLIANLGPNSQYEDQAVSQIIQSAKKENIVGVIGQPLSSNFNITRLNDAHIPMISSVEAINKQDYKFSASPEEGCNPRNLQPTTPYIFSIAPTLEREGTLGALYAEQELHAQKAILISDPQNYYSDCLATAFSNQFQRKDGKMLIEQPFYTVGSTSQLFETIRAKKDDDRDITLVYFAGFPNDLCTELPQILQTYPDIHVMGGDALYHLVYAPEISPDKSPSSCLRSNFNGLYFTTFAFPDEPSMKPLLNLYTGIFDPNKREISTYGYSRIDSDTALSYDALHTFLQLSQRILSNSNKQSLSPEELQQMLLTVTRDNSLRGATGQIFFDASGTPPAKDVLFLYVDPRGLQLLAKSSDIE